MSYTNSLHLGVAHQEWLRALDFYEIELGILRKRLEEVTSKNTNNDFRADAEHYQNQFIVQKNNLDELKHTINEHAHLVFEDAKQHVGKIEEGRIGEHKRIESDVEAYEKTIKELRAAFNKFLAKWM